MTGWIYLGIVGVLLLTYVVSQLLEEQRQESDPWGAEGDEPIAFRLTALGEGAAANPREFVLDETNETWGPAS